MPLKKKSGHRQFHGRETWGQRSEGGGQVGNGLTLKVFRKHVKRLVNYAEAGDGVRIREELKRIVPVMSFQSSLTAY